MNNMWILKNSTSLSFLEKLDVRCANQSKLSIFRHFYTSIPRDLFKSRISTPGRNPLEKKDVSIRYTYVKVNGRKEYFSGSSDSGGDKIHSANQICEMVEFLIC